MMAVDAAWQPITDADLQRAEQWLMQRSQSAVFVPADASTLSNVTAYMIREVRAARATLRATGAAPGDAGDAGRLDWLCTQYVTVRTPLRYGSKESFSGSPDIESPSWNIRAAIDKARAASQPAQGEGE